MSVSNLEERITALEAQIQELREEMHVDKITAIVLEHVTESLVKAYRGTALST